MFSDPALEALRAAATLVHASPAVRLRVDLGSRVLEVRPPHPAGAAPAGGGAGADRQVVSPCVFRWAIVQAYRERARSTVAGSGVGDGDAAGDAACDPAVAIGLPPCGASFPGGIHRVPDAVGHRYLLATTSALETCRAEARALADERDAPAGAWGLGLAPDPATDVCLAYVDLPVRAAPAAEEEAVDLLQALLARLEVRRLLADVSTSPEPR